MFNVFNILKDMKKVLNTLKFQQKSVYNLMGYVEIHF